MKPVNSRAIAVATFGLALPRATSVRNRDVRRSCAFHAMSQIGLRQRFLAVEHLPSETWHALIRPRGFREQASRVRIARLGDPAASDTRPARVLRRDEAEVRHQLRGMREPSNVADLGDETHRRDKRDPAQRLERVDHRRPAPRGRQLPQLVGEPLDAAFRFVDRVAILLQRDVLRGERES